MRSWLLGTTRALGLVRLAGRLMCVCLSLHFSFNALSVINKALGTWCPSNIHLVFVLPLVLTLGWRSLAMAFLVVGVPLVDVIHGYRIRHIPKGVNWPQ